MAYRVFMPKAGMAMKEGRILRWFKHEGDPVVKGEPLLEIETDKVGMEVEAQESGVLLKILKSEGEVVPVTETIGYIGEKGETIVEEGAVAPPVPPQGVAREPQDSLHERGLAGSRARGTTSRRVEPAATPKARRLASQAGLDLRSISATGRQGEVVARDVELAIASPQAAVLARASEIPAKATPLAARVADIEGVDLALVQGSGPGGRIRRSDVLLEKQRSHARGYEPSRVSGQTEPPASRPLSRMRKTIAERVLAVYQHTPMVTLDAKADVTELVALRDAVNERRESKISLTAFVVKACAIALKQHPNVNVRLSDGGEEILLHREIHIGVAVALEDGLLVPVVRHPESLSLSALSAAISDLFSRAREGRIAPEELSGGTFTVSNLGMYGITSFSPIINQPESAILGVCAVEPVLVLSDERVEQRKVMGLSLTIDHRLIDGVPGALFLKTVRELLENPLIMLAQ
jgi:pyruvate dehydrogenase E2 component (dihydrolipoamide acetyltransferase)